VYNSSAMEAALQVEKMDPDFLGAANVRDTPTQPWICSPYSLISWWDMRSFPLSEYLVQVRHLQEMLDQASSEDHGWVYEGAERQKSITAFREFAKDADKYGLPLTADQFRRMGSRCKGGASHFELSQMVPEALNRLQDECGRHLMLMVEPDHIKYIEDPQFFDSTSGSAKKVSTEFPSAAEDIAESGICLALGRSTACVMHLSRVLEVGLQALANALGVTKQNDWGRYLRKIDEELQKRFASSGARTADEQFYSEAYTTFDAVRRAWRNPTMHVDKTYTVERAEEILISVRSFMRHLATKLHE
jgi:hypothetical protein